MSKEKVFKDKIVLVTGGAGSIGAEIVNQLFNFCPKKIIVLDQSESNLYNLWLSHKDKDIEFLPILCDIRNEERIDQILSKLQPNIIFHCAAYKHLSILENNPAEAIDVNLLGTKALANLSIKYNIEKFVLISTDKAVKPSSVLGASKRGAEIYLGALHAELNREYSIKKNSTQLITTRFGNVLESIGSVTTIFREQIKKGGPITITNKEAERYFMSIDEACQLVLKSCEIGKGGEVFIFDMGKPIKIIDLAYKMIQSKGHIPHESIEINETGLLPGEKLKEIILDDNLVLETEEPKVKYFVPEYQKLKEVNLKIEKIKQALNKNDNLMIVNALKKLVSEYKSLNPLYKD